MLKLFILLWVNICPWVKKSFCKKTIFSVLTFQFSSIYLFKLTLSHMMYILNSSNVLRNPSNKIVGIQCHCQLVKIWIIYKFVWLSRNNFLHRTLNVSNVAVTHWRGIRPFRIDSLLAMVFRPTFFAVSASFLAISALIIAIACLDVAEYPERFEFGIFF